MIEDMLVTRENKKLRILNYMEEDVFKQYNMQKLAPSLLNMERAHDRWIERK